MSGGYGRTRPPRRALADRALPAEWGRWIVALLCLAASACGKAVDESSSHPGEGGSPPGGAHSAGGAGAALPGVFDDVMAFCDGFNDAFLRYQVRCYGGTLETWWPEIWLSPCEPLAQAAVEGRLRYDAGQANECYASLERKPCGAWLTEDGGPCALALGGQLPEGAACRWLVAGQAWDDCGPGTYCLLDSEEDWDPDVAACGGTCAPYGRDGAPCSGTYAPPLCAPGFSCGRQGCQPEAVEGEPCLGPEHPSCRFDLYCDGETESTSGTCRERQTSGSCTAGQCAYGYGCVDSGDGAASCVRMKPPGEACTGLPNECWGYCNSEGRCASRAVSGEACGLIGEGDATRYTNCAPGLYCEISTGVEGICQPQLGYGDTCTSNSLGWLPECPAIQGHLGYCGNETGTCDACE